MSEVTVLFDVGIIIIAATFLALLAKFLRQPLLGSYILAGIIIGPLVLGIVSRTEIIRMFSELGVAFLLFIVGLEMDLSRLREVRNVVLAASVASITIPFGAGFLIMFLLDHPLLHSLYVGLFLAFSSTAVLVKMMSDRGSLDSLHGRIILGILLVQDIVAVLAISALSSLSAFSFEIILSSLLKGGGMFALAVVSSKYVMPSFLELIDDSKELVFITAIAVLFGFVGLSIESGFSSAVGGFLAGIALTSFPYNVEISERARPMRDFFVTIFFVSLGMSVGSLSGLIVELVLLTLVVILLKPFIIYVVVTFFRYGKKIAFYSGSNMAQISEFSMVLALTGITTTTASGNPHISNEIFSLAVALMVISITSTSYVFKYQKKIYGSLERLMITFEASRYEEERAEMKDHVVIFGAHIKGRKILNFMEERHEDVVVVDYDPEVIAALNNDSDFRVLYGEMEDSEVLERANVGQAKAVISTVPGEENNHYLLDYVKKRNEDAVVILTANDIESALFLYEEGADYILYPKMLAAREASDIVERLYEDGLDLENARKEHIKDLEIEFEQDILKRYEPEFVKKLRDRMEDLGGDRD